MAYTWTAAQNAAITYGEGDLLVAAAAGSGKTATLTEKVVRLIRDDPTTDVSRLLIVTFTRAAAAELRARIAAGLAEALREHPERKYLHRSLLDLSRAPICTIHSFCLQVLRPRFGELGLSPDFAVAEETEAALMRRDAMREALNRFFEQPRAEDEADPDELATVLGSARDMKTLEETLLRCSETLTARGSGPEALRVSAERWLEEARTDRIPSVLWEELRAPAEHYSRLFGRLAEAFRKLSAAAGEKPEGDGKKAPPKAGFFTYAAGSEQLRDQLEAVLAAARAEDPATVGTLLAGIRAPRVRMPAQKEGADSCEEIRYYKAAKDDLLSLLQRLNERCFARSHEERLSSADQTARYLRAAARVLEQYESLYTAEKRRRNLLDFADLEVLTDRLLTRDGRPTAAAADIGAAYDRVFIDEYQDTNRMQDRIFSAVAGTKPRFLVGDVKQSIYSFRGAQPSIFESYRTSWPELTPGEAVSPAAGKGRTLYMSENFRCDRSVIDFANAVSERVLGTLGRFTAGDRLVFGKQNPPDAQEHPVEIALFPRVKRAGREAEQAAPEGDVSGGATSEAAPPAAETVSREARYVAARIEELLGTRRHDGQPLRPSDIAILTRDRQTEDGDLLRALRERGIPAVSDGGGSGDFFRQPEVLLALCLLHAVDNPSRDVYLAGLLRSPAAAGGFSMDELVAIRTAEPTGTLWDALRAYEAAHPADKLGQKCARFDRRLTEYRDMARGIGADRLMLRLFREEGLLDRCLPSGLAGQTARHHLTSLYDLARRLESRSFCGLYGFLRQVEAMAAGDLPGETVPGASAEEGVRLMTIHHAKGLEFPVVFLCGAGKPFNDRDTAAVAPIGPDGEMALRISDPGGLVRCNTLWREEVNSTIRASLKQEEARILYVALTRARERLIVTATAAGSDPDDRYRHYRNGAADLSPYTVRAAGSYLDWILQTVADVKHRASGAEAASLTPSERAVAETVVVSFPSQADAEAALPTPAAAPLPVPDATLTEQLAARAAFRYPHECLRTLPAKLIVSGLHPGILDERAEALNGAATLTAEAAPSEPGPMPLPVFLSGMPPHTAADAGIATHSFFEFCDLTRLGEEGGLAVEAERLVRERFMTQTMLDLVRREEIERFLQSDLYRRMRAARRMVREFRFYAAVPAWEFSENEAFAAQLKQEGASVLVQGVVDCLLEEADGRLLLVDYKTDRLTPEERRDPEKAAAKLIPRHRDQLLYYRAAVEKMLGRTVDEVAVYSLPLGALVNVPTSAPYHRKENA